MPLCAVRRSGRGCWNSSARTSRPRSRLTQVSTLAEVAIDRVFSAHRLTEQQCSERHGSVKDYAECAALYGYVLGYWQARQEAYCGTPAALAES